MENTNPETIDSTIDTPVEETETTTEETKVEEAPATEPEESEDVEALKAKNSQLYARAKKAEEEAKKLKTSKPESEASNLSTKDTIAIIEAKVHSEDIDEVVEYAKFKGISTTEALKTNVVKTMLRERAEERKTAEATNTGTARRGASKVSDESILENAKSGKLPDSDTDLDRLVRTRLEKQRSKA